MFAVIALLERPGSRDTTSNWHLGHEHPLSAAIAH